MYDADMRVILRANSDHPEHLCDEVNLNSGKARIDVLDISSELLGYEIKSDNDSFARLGRQSKVYNDTLSKVIIVIGDKFLDRVKSVVPEFWGIIHCYKCPAGIGRLETIREAKPNPHYSARRSVEVLWKSELTDLILTKGKCPGLFGKRKIWMQKRICEVYAQSELPALIAAKMRSRTNWR